MSKTQVIQLFVSNIAYTSKTDDFKSYMTKDSRVTDARLVMCRDGIHNKGYGFVTLSDGKFLEEIKKSDKFVYDGRMLRFSDYVNQHKFYRIHVGNVPEKMTEQQLYDVFSAYGKIDNVKKDIHRMTGTPKGTASIVFTNYDDFRKVLDSKNININFEDKECVMLVTKRRMNKFIGRPIYNGMRSMNMYYAPKPYGRKLTIQRVSVSQNNTQQQSK